MLDILPVVEVMLDILPVVEVMLDILPVVEVMLDILEGVVPTPLRLYCCIHQSISYETPKKIFFKKSNIISSVKTRERSVYKILT